MGHTTFYYILLLLLFLYGYFYHSPAVLTNSSLVSQGSWYTVIYVVLKIYRTVDMDSSPVTSCTGTWSPESTARPACHHDHQKHRACIVQSVGWRRESTVPPPPSAAALSAETPCICLHSLMMGPQPSCRRSLLQENINYSTIIKEEDV